MYIIVPAAHPRHCQSACILPVSKLPGTWREILRAITLPPLRGVSSLASSSAADSVCLHGDSMLTSGILLTPFNVHFLRQKLFLSTLKSFSSSWISLKANTCHLERLYILRALLSQVSWNLFFLTTEYRRSSPTTMVARGRRGTVGYRMQKKKLNQQKLYTEYVCKTDMSE